MNKKHAAVEREKKMSNQRQLNCRCCLCGGKLSDSVERTVVLFVRKETEKEGEGKRWQAGLKEEAAEFFLKWDQGFSFHSFRTGLLAALFCDMLLRFS